MARKAEEVASVISRGLRLVRSRIPVSKAFLFGSYPEGTADEYSDIDIAVFSAAADGMTFQEKVSFVCGAKGLANTRPTNCFGHICTHGKPTD